MIKINQIVVVTCILHLTALTSGCNGNESAEDTNNGSDSSTETHSGTNSDSDTGSGSASEPGSDSDTGTGTASEPDSGSVSDTGTGTASEPDSDSDSDTGTGTAAEPDSDSVSDTGTGTASEPDSDSDSVSDTGTGTASEPDSDSVSDSDSDGRYCYYEDLRQTQVHCLDHGETCDDPEVLPTEDGTYVFSNAPFLGNYTWTNAPMECTPSEKLGQDLVYALDLPSMKKLSARVDGISSGGIGFYPKLFVSTSCDELVASCVAGQSASFENVRAEYTNNSEHAVRLYLVVDSDIGDAGLFSLDIKIVEPEIAKEIGESCAQATSISLPSPGDSLSMTFSHAALDEAPSEDNVCESTGRDGFFTFTVDAPYTVRLNTLTAISSKHAVFLYQDGCGIDHVANFKYLQLGSEPVETSCGVSKYSSALGGYYTQIEIEAEPGIQYAYGVQLFAASTATSEFTLTITVD